MGVKKYGRRGDPLSLNNTQLEKCPASNLAYTQLLLKIVASCEICRMFDVLSHLQLTLTNSMLFCLVRRNLL
jgi:hypothetical protein